MTGKDQSPEKKQDMFRGSNEQFMDIEYRHPREEQLLTDLKTVLAGTKTGKNLLEHAQKKNLDIYLIKHKEIRGSAPEGKIIYLFAPAEKQEIEPRMVLELAAGLREAEQTHKDYDAPGPGMDSLEFAVLSHAKNLDIVVHMCRVAFELHQNLNTQDYVDVLEEMGHGGIYDAYVRDFSSEKIVDTYYAQGS